MLHRLFVPACVLALSPLALAQPLTTAFTFQGQLRDSGVAVGGLWDMRFRLYDNAMGGNQVGPTLCADNVPLSSGAFATQLDFGPQFLGAQRFLEVEVREDIGRSCADTTGFVTLSPRQALTAAPSALYALGSSTANSATLATLAANASSFNGQGPAFYQNASNLAAGYIPSDRLAGIYTSTLAFTNPGNQFAGSGAGLVGIPWSAINDPPEPVLLQSAIPDLAQPGSLHVAGYVAAARAAINTVASTYDLEVGGPARVRSNHTEGQALILDGPVPMGLYVHSSSAPIACSLETNLEPASSTQQGGGILLASAGPGAIQFAVRPPGASVPTTAMTINSDAQVSIGELPRPGELFRVHNSSPTGATTAGAFQCDSLTGTALFANAPATTGTTYALFAQDASPGGAAVHALASASSGVNYGLWASNSSSGGYAGFFQGPGIDCVLINNTASGRALHLTSSSDSALLASTSGGSAAVTAQSGAMGVNAVASNPSGVTYGILGAANSPIGYGLYSNGNSGASGLKSFRIDHPADPEHKYLLHYSTESPEVLNFYSGNVTLNQQGEATIDLPAYFARINKDPRYLLTPIGAPMPLLHIAEEISNDALEQGANAAPTDPVPTCSFRIAGGAPNAKVSWRIEALRNDRWVQAHGAPTEVEKHAPEAGTYQHPDLYDQPATLATFHSAPTTP